MSKIDLNDILKALNNAISTEDNKVHITMEDKNENQKVKEPTGKYLNRALDFFYDREFDDVTEDFYTAILRSEDISFRWFRFDTENNRKARELVIDICDMLDHGARIREIAEELHVKFDTVCIVRSFFKDEEGEN